MSQISRRELLAGAAAVGALLLDKQAFAKASQPSTKVNFDIPAGACDTHTHIFADQKVYPLSPNRMYTPEEALPPEMKALHKALHMERVVIVNPSIYGTDNRASLFGMKAYGPGARGVAVIDEKTPESELDSMHQAGMRGIRINLATQNQTDPALGRKRLIEAIERVKRRNWHVQMYVAASIIPGIKDIVMSSPVPVVFDHFGGAASKSGLKQPGFPELVEMVKAGKAYVKISGAYRASTNSPGYEDLVPYAKALIAANADRVVWGTDWPHPDSAPPQGRKATELNPVLQIDDGRLLNLLPVWAPDAQVRKKILVDNPAKLYGY
ncbi:MAG: amidohydrolase family protein [Bryobacteraceae bacterium]